MTNTENKAQNPLLTIYTTTWCGYCKRLKMGLANLGLEWKEINIESDLEAKNFVEKINDGNAVVPTVTYYDGETVTNPSILDIKRKLDL